MSDEPAATRRAFLAAGTLIATLGATAAAAGATRNGGRAPQPPLTEDEAAIRSLHAAWLREVNRGAVAPSVAGGEVRSIAPDPFGPADAIALSADRRRAVGRFHCAVGVETGSVRDCALAPIGHAVGSGVVRATGRRVLEVDYVRVEGGWMIARAAFGTA